VKQPYIKISNYQKEYKTQTITVKDIEISSRITFLIGENGCGKSTLIQSILNINQYKGSITSTKTISYMPDLYYFPKDIKVITLLNTHQFYFQYSFEKQLDLITYFDMSEHLNKYIKDLSKGMKMKLNIILCLSRNEEVYILDEPFSGLDLHHKQKLLQYIEQDSHYYILTTHHSHADNLTVGECICID
jgi:ABC-2 type transport system ATP-binding protein